MKADTPETDAAVANAEREDDIIMAMRSMEIRHAAAMLHTQSIADDANQYAAMLSEAMEWVYANYTTSSERADLIARFERLELTPGGD